MSDETYYQAHREERLKWQQNYYNENKNSIKEKDRIRNQKYYEEHKDEKLERGRRWREENRIMMSCECGSQLFKCNLSKHCKSKKHQAYLDKIQSENEG